MTVGWAFTVRPLARVTAPASGLRTVTDRSPVAAAAATVTVASIVVELTTVTVLTVTPVPPNTTVAPDTKFEPVIVIRRLLTP